MRCSDINILAYLDGNESDEAKNHIKGCAKCADELERLKLFTEIITTHYAKGLDLDRKLDKQLSNIDMSNLEPLPPKVQKRVDELKKSSFAEKINKIVGKKRNNVLEIVENLLTPQIQALPASPKDLAKTKKKDRNKKKP